jgi:AP-1-like factor
LKNLETKVEELTKASEAANHENSKLRAQVSQMTTELNQYKQRLSLLPDQKPTVHSKQPFGNPAVSNLNDINFQFNFPKFGSLPGPQPNKPQRSVSQPISPHQQQQQATSPTKSQMSDNKSPPNLQQTSQDAFKEDYSKFSGIFTPSMTSSTANGSRASLDSANYSSPSASSNSNAGPSSSCGTSPEPFTQQSPMGSKPVETMTTIGEEQTSLSSEPFTQFANIDFGSNTNFDWLAQQNGGFEPDIFNDYRDPQESVPSNITFDDYFNDAVDVDFFTPYNMAPSPNFAKAAAPQPKKNLIDEIDAQKNDFDDVLKPQTENMSCNQIWYAPSSQSPRSDSILTTDYREKLQACPKAQSGDFDLDGLCSELTKKAKCSGTGPVVGEQDFDTILRKYMGKDVSSDCVASSLGIEVNRDAKPNGVGMP